MVKWTLKQQVIEKHKAPVYGISFNDIGSKLHQLVATAGGNQISVYRVNTVTNDMKLLHAYIAEDEPEEFFVVKWMLLSDGSHVLVAGGAQGVLHVLDVRAHKPMCRLLGHGERVNDLETHPTKSDLLFSCSKDESVRLWDVRAQIVLVIFAGLEGHTSEVVTIGAHGFRDSLFASGGMDDSIKIWSWTDRLPTMHHAGTGTDVCLQVETPVFSSSALHVNYVDCLAWYGDVMISKSVDNCLVMWKPAMDLDVLQSSHQAPQSQFIVLREFELTNCSLWFIRFKIHLQEGLLACGNQQGQVHIWKIEDPDAKMRRVQCPPLSPVRIVDFHSEGKHLLCALEGGELCLIAQSP